MKWIKYIIIAVVIIFILREWIIYEIDKDDGKEVIIGEILIDNVSKKKIKFSYTIEILEEAYPLHYSIIDSSNLVIKSPSFLIGLYSGDIEDYDISKFKIKNYNDSIQVFIDTNIVSTINKNEL